MAYFKYPLDTLNGDILLHDSFNTAIGDAVNHVLSTELEERVMRPEYGIEDIIFKGYDLQTLNNLIVDVLATGLAGFNVIYNVTCSFGDEGILAVKVQYDENTVEVILNVST
jgi:hypothetical protein